MSTFEEPLLSTARARGRGRGRGRSYLTTEENDARNRNPQSFTAEDVTDGCIVQQQHRFRELDERYREDSVDDKSSEKLIKPTTKGSNTEKRGGPQAIQPDQDVVVVTVKIVEVEFMQKYVVAQFGGKSEKCNVRLYESSLMKKWMAENNLMIKSDTLVENAVLSALEFNIGESFYAYPVSNCTENGYTSIFIDLIKSQKLKKDFIVSLIFMMIPRLPEVGQHKSGFITNIKEPDRIDVVFNKQIWMGLRETIHKLQVENRLLAPRCPVMQELFKEMIEGFSSRYFLAPLHDEWNELYRVHIVGIEFNHMVKVHYVDLGKVGTLGLKHLAVPLPSNHVSDLLDKIPAQAVSLRVAKLDDSLANVYKSLRSALEGRVCYVQTLDDAIELAAPVVDIFVTSSQEKGTVSLFDLVNGCANRAAPPINTEYKAEPLVNVETKLEAKMKDWEAAFLRMESELMSSVKCQCCKENQLVCGKLILPSVYRCIRSENNCRNTDN